MKNKTIIILVVVLTAIVFSFLAPFCFASWDNTKPADNRVWNSVAGDIRANNDALEVVMGVDLLVNHPYFQASTPTKKPDGSTNLDANDLGRIWIDSDDLVKYVFTAVTPTWTAYPSLTAANTFAVPPTWTLGVIANNTFLTATDNAGTGTANLIKANTSDLAVLPDGALLDAATESGDGDRTIADKGYVDAGQGGQEFQVTDATDESVIGAVGSFVDIDSMTTTQTFNGGKVLIMFVGTYRTLNDVQLDFAINVGGANVQVVSIDDNQGATIPKAVSIHWLVTAGLTGSQTVKMQWKQASGAATAQFLSATDGAARTLTVIEFD